MSPLPISTRLAALLLASLGTIAGAISQVHLVSSIGATNDWFGGAAFEIVSAGGPGVAVSGEVVVVSSARTDYPGQVDQGSVVVFRRVGSTWVEEQILTSSIGAQDDYFGFSVAVCDDVIVVGSALAWVGPLIHQGYATVFRWNGTTWDEEQILFHSNALERDYFGYSISISGDVIVVGAPSHDVGSEVDQGAAYVFRFNGANWVEQQVLTAADGEANDLFGTSVSVSGTSIVVSLLDDDVGAVPVAGSARVYRGNGASWVEEQTLVSPVAGFNDEFGMSVSVSGDVIACGAGKADPGGVIDAGTVTVFEWDGASWVHTQTLTHPSPAASDWFGNAVCVNGDSIAVGAANDDVGSKIDVGSAYVYRWDGSTWALRSTLSPGAGKPYDSVGGSVAIDSEVIVVGAPDTTVGVNVHQGKAYLYNPIWWPWSDQGAALAGVYGAPLLSPAGNLAVGSNNSVDLSLAAPNAPAALFLALAGASLPFKGGTLKPFPFFPLVFLTTSPTGTLPVPFVMPAGVPSGTELWVQWAIGDAAAIKGVALSNAQKGTVL